MGVYLIQKLRLALKGRKVQTMKVTLGQAMLIMNHVIRRDTDISDITVFVDVNDHTFSDNIPVHMAKTYGSFAERAKDGLVAIGEDSKAMTCIISTYSGKRTLCFAKLY